MLNDRINESYFKNFHRLMLVDMLYLHLTRSLNIFPDYCIYTIALIRENIDEISLIRLFICIYFKSSVWIRQKVN